MSSEAFVDVQDAATPTKHMRTKRATVSGTPVDSEVVVLSTDGVDSYDARQTRALTSSDVVAVNNATFIANNAASGAADKALEIKLSSLGSALITNAVPVSIAAPVSVNQNTNPWLTSGTRNENSAPIAGANHQVLAAKDTNNLLQFLPLDVSGFNFPLALRVVFNPSDTGTVNVAQQGGVDVSDRAGRLLGRLNGNVSAGNSSTALLGISAVFTGTYENVTDYAAITISIFSDQASAIGGLEFDWSHDGVNLDASSTSSVLASSGRAFSIAPRARFFRVKYTNGATGQGVFRLGTVYHPTGSGLISRPLNQSLDQDNYAQQIRSVTDGYDGSVFQHVGARTSAPLATDYGLVTRGLVYRNTLLGLYYGESGNLTVLASAHAATAGFFWLVNTSSTVKVYIRSIGFVWSGTAATAFPTSPRITVERITFTGTPSGATITPAKRASADATNTATLRTASTGLTITAGAVIESFVVGSILTAVGAVSVPEEMWQSPDDDGMILLAQNEGIVVRQADAGTTADSRKVVMTVAWEER